MDEEVADAQSDLQKCISDGPMDTDEGPLINENSNGLSHLLTEGEFNSVDAVGVDESSTSNQAFLNAVELSAGSVGDYLENNTEGFNTDSFDVGDNANQYPSDSMNNLLSDGDSRPSEIGENGDKGAAGDTDSDACKRPSIDTDGDLSQSQPAKMETDNEPESEVSNEVSNFAHIGETTTPTPTTNESFEQEVKDVEARMKSEPEESQMEVQEPGKSEHEESQMEVKEPGKTEIKKEVDSSEDATQDKVDQPKKSPAETGVSVKSEVKKEIKPEPEVGGAEETEVVSEDELPEVQKPSVKDAENVSDDELPGPKPADLPADTEVVSEDELPSAKKEAKESRKRIKPDDSEEKGDYDPQSPTSESESASKKLAVAKNGESKPIPAEKRTSTDEKPKKKVLPELDKYWKVVNDDPTDFTGWTYLLQYVDQESDVDAAREAYDAFLSHYPYCYGYWRKYADYEKRKGSKKKCLDVLERGLKAIPLSVDLWIHYLNHVKATRGEDHAYIRSQYERAIEACGLEFRSDRLWEAYVKWQAEAGDPLQVTQIYDRLLATPTLGYTTHFDNFQEHVMSESVKNIISKEELVRLRAEVRAAGGGGAPPLDLPPGEDEPPDNVASDEEAQAIKERIIAARRKVHKATGEEVAARWTFEEGIKRPYFHVKPLERCQLKNWKAYLEWEKQHGSLRRALVLHERCLIACALYDEFWMRLIKFLEERSESNPELVALERSVLERACTVHHPDKPELALHWAHFEEARGHDARAAEILERAEKQAPTLVQIQYRRVNLERRRGDYEKCIQLFEQYIATAKNKSIASALAIKYARFLYHVRSDAAAARKVLDEAVAKDPLNERLHLQRLDLALHTPNTPFTELEELVQSYEKQEGADAEASARFAWRRRELAEELGGAAEARAAAMHQRALARHLRKRARKEKHDAPTPAAPTDVKKKESSTSNNSAAAAPAGGYYQPPAAPPQYDQNYAQGYQPPPWGYQQPPGPYQHPHPGWPQYPNYY